MYNSRTAKYALIMSAFALCLCISCLVGSTYAWFTESVNTNENIIQSGNIEVDLEMLERDGSWTSIGKTGKPVFSYEGWEPGYTDVKILRINNKGSLALQWIAKFDSQTELSHLANVIDVYVSVGAAAYPSEPVDLSSWTKMGTVAEFMGTVPDAMKGTLEKGENYTIGVAFKLRDNADSMYQGMTLGAFDILLIATQHSSEYDSFGNNYDADADKKNEAFNPNNVKTASGFVNALKNLKDGETVKLMNDIALGDVDIILQDWTVTGTAQESGTTVNVVKYANKVYNIDLNGYKLSATNHAIDLHGGTLNIKNGTISMNSADQNGTFISVGGHSPVYDGHKAMKCGQDEYNPTTVLNLENVAFEGTMAANTTGTTTGHIIYVNCHAQVHIKNCSFKTMMDNGEYANHIDVWNEASAMIDKATAVYVYEGTKFYGDPTFQEFKDVDNSDWNVKGGHLIYIAEGYELEAAPVANGDTYPWYTVVLKED